MRYLFLLISVFSYSQQTNSVDFTSVLGKIEINALDKSVSGEVNYIFKLSNPIDTIKIDAQNIDFSNLKINNIEVKYINNRKQILLYEGYKLGVNQLTFNYWVQPNQAMYFVGKGEQLQIWTQGQGKYTSNWFPSFDDPNEKLIFNLDIKFNTDFQVVSNGKLESKTTCQDNFIWNYRMKKPMSSYLLMLAIGKFEIKQEKSQSGKSLFYYIEKEDYSKLEPTYRYSKTIFDFLEKEIGVKYPWEVYKQVPVRDFLYAGMENTSATVFSRDFVVDSIGFNDKNYVNVNTHELAHQWFGDLITAQSGKHHWLQEGFATYYALLAEKEVFGEDYFYKKLFDTALQLKSASKTDSNPIVSDKASSLTYYQKGAWVLFVLREEVGSKIFQKAVKNYLKKHSFKNVVTDDFLNEIQKISKFDCDSFGKKWLENSNFDYEYAIKLLSKNKSIQLLLDTKKMKSIPFNEKRDLFEKLMASTSYFPIKEEIIYQCEKVPYEEKQQLLKLALATHEINVRQAIANTTPKVPLDFKADFESLLNDTSYITKEIALSTVWSQFPEDHKRILDNSKQWIGFNDKNLRILWLTLALGTKEYQMADKVNYYDELLNYCNPEFETSIRQNAIENLLFINDKDQNVLPNLVNSLVSYKWQFSKFGKDKLRLILKNPTTRNYLEQLLPNLSNEENVLLTKIINEKTAN
jgi:aminopeptidase N